VVTVLARVGRPQDQAALGRAIVFLAQQEADGSWFGPLGHALHLRYLVGTTAFAQAGISPDEPASAAP